MASVDRHRYLLPKEVLSRMTGQGSKAKFEVGPVFCWSPNKMSSKDIFQPKPFHDSTQGGSHLPKPGLTSDTFTIKVLALFFFFYLSCHIISMLLQSYPNTLQENQWSKHPFSNNYWTRYVIREYIKWRKYSEYLLAAEIWKHEGQWRMFKAISISGYYKSVQGRKTAIGFSISADRN